MREPIVVTESVRVPAGALTVRAVRASGPGGQNVNKVATKIQLSVALDRIEGLPEAARARLQTLARHRLDAQGHVLISSQATRNRALNLEDARAKVRSLLLTALVEPRRRRPSQPSAGAKERRLTEKKRRSVLKRSRAKPDE